jgi:hypothetical protein
MSRSSKTVGIRRDLIDAATGWVKAGVSPPTSVLADAETYADGVPETGFSIPDKRSPWDGFMPDVRLKLN